MTIDLDKIISLVSRSHFGTLTKDGELLVLLDPVQLTFLLEA